MKELIERIDRSISDMKAQISALDLVMMPHVCIDRVLELLLELKAALSQKQEAAGYVDQVCGTTAHVNIREGQSIVAGQDVYTSPPSTAQGVVANESDNLSDKQSCDSKVSDKVPQSVEEFAWANFVSYLIDNCEGEAITEERLQHALSDMMTGVRYCPSMPVTYREAELKGVVVNNNLAGDQILLAHPPHTTIPIGTVMIACTHPDISHDCCVVCGKNIMPNKPDFEWTAAFLASQPTAQDGMVMVPVDLLESVLDGELSHNHPNCEYRKRLVAIINNRQARKITLDTTTNSSTITPQTNK